MSLPANEFPLNDPPEGGTPSLVEPIPLGAPSSVDAWADEAMRFATELDAVEAAIGVLRQSLPAAIQQAADLGLMREQHDAAGLRMVVRGEQALNQDRDRRQEEDHAALVRLEGRVAMVEAKLDRVLAWMEAHP